MQRLEVSGAVRLIYRSLGVKRLIDVAISGDRNVIKKEAEKILKYKDLTIEIQRMWNVLLKWSMDYFNNCNFSTHELMRSVMMV